MIDPAEHNIVSVSGGKDSASILLFAGRMLRVEE